MDDKKTYPCDPNKNTECPGKKRFCNFGKCTTTTNPEYARTYCDVCEDGKVIYITAKLYGGRKAKYCPECGRKLKEETDA